jgi:hypothetical protein
VRSWRRREAAPVLTLASMQELWAMLRAGIEPAGIAGGFASVETTPGSGLIGIDLDVDGVDPAGSRGLPGLKLAVHVLATAVRRRSSGAVGPSPVVGVAEGADG